MDSVHPTSSAGDGKAIDQSSYIKKSEKLDNIINCAQCGFPVNLDQRSTGDSMGAIGDPTLSSESGTPPSPGIAFSYTKGDPVDTGSGCPFCNSMDPRASQRGKTGFEKTRPSIENL